MEKPIKNIRPEVIFIVIGFIVGTLLSIFIPYGAGFDEESHLARIFDIASGNLIPNHRKPDDIVYSEFYTMDYKRSYLQTPALDYFSPERFNLKPDLYNASEVNTNSTYSPVVFIVEAIFARVAWIYLKLPIFPVIHFLRFVGLCLFLLMGYLTIKIIPFGKWVITILLLSPMTIYQAATLNGDRFTNWAAFFFIASVLFAYSKKDRPIDKKQTFLLILGTLLVGVSKPGTIILYALFLILLGRKFENNRLKWLFFGAIAAAVIYSVSWSMLFDMETPVQTLHTPRIDQFKLILSNIPDFLKVYFVGVFHLIPRYYTDWAAEYGNWMGTVPRLVYLLYPISLLLAFMAEAKNEILTKKTRWIIFLVGLGTLAIIASIKFIFYYIPGQYYFQAQGRYFIPFAPLVYLAFVGLIDPPFKLKRLVLMASIAMIIATLGFYGYGVYRTFYTTCVFAVDATHPCKLPVYRNLDTLHPVKEPLNTGTIFEQTFVPKCSPINAIDLNVLSLEGEKTGTANLSLYTLSGKLLAESQLPLSQIIVGGQNRFGFSSAEIQPDDTYSFRVSLSDDSKATMNVWGTPDDGYNVGQLLINKSPSDSSFDLYFQYECPMTKPQ